MNYAMAIDMWSLGCILAELYTGVPIFPGENEHEQLACIMEVLGVPDRYIVDKASRRKLFFDATGSPRPFVNAKGKRRRPSAKTLGQVLKCDDELFIDFIAKCLTWDPDKRLKPQPALRHPWILAGRRRQAPSAPMAGTSNSALRQSSSGSGSRGNSGSMLISPPTPLVARANGQTVPASAQRYGHPARDVNMSTSSSRLGTLRASAYPVSQIRPLAG
jgi:dual specificity tyrosine-phosphorylation-regulated kinase 2/3/4